MFLVFKSLNLFGSSKAHPHLGCCCFYFCDGGYKTANIWSEKPTTVRWRRTVNIEKDVCDAVSRRDVENHENHCRWSRCRSSLIEIWKKKRWRRRSSKERGKGGEEGSIEERSKKVGKKIRKQRRWSARSRVFFCFYRYLLKPKKLIGCRLPNRIDPITKINLEIGWSVHAL